MPVVLNIISVRRHLKELIISCQFGDVYDRTYEGMDLYTQYGEGTFEMKMGLYELEQRNPRKLAKVFSQWYPKAVLTVEKNRNYFVIKAKYDRRREVCLVSAIRSMGRGCENRGGILSAGK